MYVSFHSQERVRVAACTSLHVVLLAKRHRIYALNVGKAVGGGPLPDEASGLRRSAALGPGGWWRGGGRGSPFARICILAPDRGFTPARSRCTDSGAVDGLSSSAVLSGLSVLVGSCYRNHVNAQYRESRKGDRPSLWRCVTPVGFRGPCRWPCPSRPDTNLLRWGVSCWGERLPPSCAGTLRARGGDMLWGSAWPGFWGQQQRDGYYLCQYTLRVVCVCARAGAITHVGVLLMALVSSCCIFFFFSFK